MDLEDPLILCYDSPRLNRAQPFLEHPRRDIQRIVKIVDFVPVIACERIMNEQHLISLPFHVERKQWYSTFQLNLSATALTSKSRNDNLFILRNSTDHLKSEEGW